MNAKVRFVLAAAAVAAFCGVSARPAHAILTNVALGKPTSSSGIYPGFPDSNGVDGNTGNFTHSGTNVGPVFWQVDLSASVDLVSIEVVNRAACCPERLNGAVLSVLDSAMTPIFTAPPFAAAGDGQTFSFDNGGAGFAGAQFIRVDQNNQWLSIAELRAFVDVPPPPFGNLANLFGTATQSTTGYGLPASGAIDGNRAGGSISHTDDGDLTPSFSINLGNLYRMERIELYTRSGCCTETPPMPSPERDYNLTVEVLDADGNVVYTHPVLNPWDGVDPPGGAPVIGEGASFVIDLPGTGVVGQSIHVSKVAHGGPLHSEWLSIAELEVYGSTTAVPEPSSVCLAALGLFGGVLVARRGRK